MDSWADTLVSMMTSHQMNGLRMDVKKEEELSGRDCSPADSSLYSPTTTGLQLELELSQGDIIYTGESGSYESTPPSIVRSVSSPETDGDPDCEKQYCSSTTTSGNIEANRSHRMHVELAQGLGLTSLSNGLCRSMSRSYSSPEPDNERDSDKPYCSSTTSTVPADFNRHRLQGDYKDGDTPKRLCLVCGDIASGFHYGVASCEACKAFFKRTIQGNIEYTCPATNDCEINKRRRKACQACRYQKCIGMGMLKEGVRLDRVRGGRQKYRRLAPYNLDSVTPCKKTSIEDNKLLCILNQCEPETLNTVSLIWTEEEISSTVDPVLRNLCILSELYDRELVSAIGWAKQIPGFLELPLSDQMRLLQTSWPEILTLSLAYRSVPVASGSARLHWTSDFSLGESEAKECCMEEFYHQCIQIALRLEQLSVTREEYFLLKTLVLTNSDVRVDSTAILKKLRENILNALLECVTSQRQGASTVHIHQLLLCLPSIRQADATLRRFWSGVKCESRVPMNKLFLEMLETPQR